MIFIRIYMVIAEELTVPTVYGMSLMGFCFILTYIRAKCGTRSRSEYYSVFRDYSRASNEPPFNLFSKDDYINLWCGISRLPFTNHLPSLNIIKKILVSSGYICRPIASKCTRVPLARDT